MASIHRRWIFPPPTPIFPRISPALSSPSGSNPRDMFAQDPDKEAYPGPGSEQATRLAFSQTTLDVDRKGDLDLGKHFSGFR